MEIKTFEKEDKITSCTAAWVKVPNGFGKFYFSKAGGNCKLAHISDIGNVHVTNFKDLANKIREIMIAKDRLCFEVNISDFKLIENLNEYFPLVSITPVPIGYDDSFTYFAVFLANEHFESGEVDYESVLERVITQKEEIKDFKYECRFGKK
jgi:hypothetical protein